MDTILLAIVIVNIPLWFGMFFLSYKTSRVLEGMNKWYAVLVTSVEENTKEISSLKEQLGIRQEILNYLSDVGKLQELINHSTELNSRFNNLTGRLHDVSSIIFNASSTAAKTEDRLSDLQARFSCIEDIIKDNANNSDTFMALSQRDNKKLAQGKLKAKQARLQALEEIRAVKGFDSPPHILIEIEQIDKQIRELQQELTLY